MHKNTYGWKWCALSPQSTSMASEVDTMKRVAEGCMPIIYVSRKSIRSLIDVQRLIKKLGKKAYEGKILTVAVPYRKG